MKHLRTLAVIECYQSDDDDAWPIGENSTLNTVVDLTMIQFVS